MTKCAPSWRACFNAPDGHLEAKERRSKLQNEQKELLFLLLFAPFCFSSASSDWQTRTLARVLRFSWFSHSQLSAKNKTDCLRPLCRPFGAADSLSE